MSIDVVKTCPLGHTCEKVADGKLERCMWYTKMEGINPQNGEKLDRWDCAITWQPLLMVENSKNSMMNTNAILSFRNETVKRQDEALKAIDNVKSNNIKQLR